MPPTNLVIGLLAYAAIVGLVVFLWQLRQQRQERTQREEYLAALRANTMLPNVWDQQDQHALAASKLHDIIHEEGFRNDLQRSA